MRLSPLARSPKDRAAAASAWAAFGLVTALFVAGVVLYFVNRAISGSGPGASVTTDIALFAGLYSFPLVGVVVASRQPQNAIARIFLAIGAAWGLAVFNDTYGYYGLVSNPGAVPAPDLAVVLGGNTMWVPAVGLMGTFLILLFPDGRLPSPRWRPLAWLSAIAITLSFAVIMFMPGALAMAGQGWEGVPAIRNPLGLESLRPVLEPLTFVIALIPLCFVGCAVSLVQRFRRSRGVERLQLKWLAFATATVAGIYLLVMLLSLVFLVGGTSEPAWLMFLSQLSVFSFPLIPIAAGIAILKHRLFDIDVVIKKTVLFGSLAGFITVVYIAVVVGVGSLLGSTGDGDLGLSVVATAIVAVAFQPVRQRFEHLANRLVYGRRASPYEVLSEFSGRVAETYATDDVLPRMAREIREGIGAAHAGVWLRAGKLLRPAASSPLDEAGAAGALPVVDDQLPAFDGVDRAVAVRHQGQLLGALTVTKPPAEPLTPAEDALLANLASQAGLVLRNVGLTTELLARLDELTESRKRLVAAQDQERRRIERDLHDGAQQNLIALKTRLTMVKRIGQRDPGKALDLVPALEELAGETLDTLRDLARGIYPPLLAEGGLKAALEGQARKTAAPVEVRADGLARYSQEIESAAYFCCLEALQNASKYAQPAQVLVRLCQEDGCLTFSVQDDGRGFDPTTAVKGAGTQNMTDRVEALGGTLTITSSPGHGTTVVGRIPLGSASASRPRAAASAVSRTRRSSTP